MTRRREISYLLFFPVLRSHRALVNLVINFELTTLGYKDCYYKLKRLYPTVPTRQAVIPVILPRITSTVATIKQNYKLLTNTNVSYERKRTKRRYLQKLGDLNKAERKKVVRQVKKDS